MATFPSLIKTGCKKIKIIQDKYNKKLYGFTYGGKLIRSGYVSKSGILSAINRFKRLPEKEKNNF